MAQKILEGLTDNERIRANYNKVLAIRDRIDKLMKEVRNKDRFYFS